MQVNLNKEDLKHLRKQIDQNEQNIFLSNVVMVYVNNYYETISLQDIANYTKQGLSQDAAVIRYHVERIATEFTVKEKDVLTKALTKLHQLDYAQYSDNPYFKDIQIPTIDENGWSLTRIGYPPYEVFIDDDLSYGPDYQEELSLAYFDQEYTYPVAIQNDEIWMAVTPNEIKTAQSYVDEAKGRVITFGLGLGYYPYMVSLKPDVESVTIVEKDENVINLFQKFILPQFKHKDKIKIIQADAYEVLTNKTQMTQYDYIYIDIWHGPEEGVYHYIKMKQIEKRDDLVFHYWLQPSILAYLRRAMIALLQENLAGYQQSAYQKSKNEFDDLMNGLYKVSQEIKLTTYQEIIDLLTDQSLTALILKL